MSEGDSEAKSEDRQSVDWDARFRADDAPWERGELHPAFTLWLDAGLIAAGKSVYVPGCGRSLEPLAFASLGLTVSAVDYASSAIVWQWQQFKAAGLTGTLVTGDALAFRPDRPVDLYYEQTFLCAIHPSKREEYEAAAYAQIAPGGHLLALFMQKQERGGPPYGCDMADMRALFSGERWAWPDAEPQAFPHPSLGGKAELAVALRRKP
ncbi:thiopurine S-methyltransferase [Aquisalinus flavus]|uniref:SAM-dependent methyltransferase n=1 Tax=Aquisalinus flavus TaxID=1526572 RepID=A0A8J2V4X2_9PROT|nr:thiopurine S-methyltransferase [Aquisalinus flavus]MBD0427942.1 thiopurine S-methyltransferase [Aquisalinus flavus]UNE47699.1 thiopurine S-methyltransferase [Aquisalinus flavus]GGD05168.1 SAM-dependent methyltransferase [Aquisalinus flavus]